jgi:hypothetical protein
MKSAYELAMERLKQGDEGEEKPLTEEVKQALAEIDEKYKAKIAEREIFLSQKLQDTLSKGDMAEAEAIRAQMASEKARLEEEREAAKEKTRAEG